MALKEQEKKEFQEQLEKKLKDFNKIANDFINYHTEIKQFISTNKVNFNKEFVTFAEFKTVLTSVAWRISGKRVVLQGDNNTLYEISAPNLLAINTIREDEYEIVEVYSENISRATRIHFAKKAEDKS